MSASAPHLRPPLMSVHWSPVYDPLNGLFTILPRTKPWLCLASVYLGYAPENSVICINKFAVVVAFANLNHFRTELKSVLTRWARLTILVLFAQGSWSGKFTCCGRLNYAEPPLGKHHGAQLHGGVQSCPNDQGGMGQEVNPGCDI